MSSDFVDVQSLSIPAPENWLLGATLHENRNPNPNSPVILMSSAAGVPQGYYENFCIHLVEQGAHAVLSYDYRGMSKSAGDRNRWAELRMFHWAEHDFAAAAHYLKSRYGQRPMVGMGHSFGGQALGMSGVSGLFERYCTVATMSGYWRDLDTPYSVWIKTQLIGRPLANLLGYIPKRMGLGDTFPGKVFLDWATWINDPHYWFQKQDVPGLENYEKVTLPFLSIGLKDDPWGTVKAIGSFMKYYKSAQMTQITLDPTDSGTVGHLGFFRKRHQEYHWPVATDFLLNGTLPPDTTG